ncbi:MAG TPA: YjbE family putative metal transport protein, partial [Chloroflexota bacterium]|nr:YjbE family putative metal transport protein [Chloroflexota bacterium]
MELITTALGLIVINLVLSGDNAVVIGMAAHKLEGKQRLLAIIFGGIAAIVLRVAFTALAAILLQIPALQFVGGAMLVWIAFKLLNEDGGEEKGKTANSLLQAVWIITAADIIMSLDNILAVAAVSRGDMTTLIVGLAMSMPLVLFC